MALEQAFRPLRSAQREAIPDGAVAIAAITSCTNTSDPRLLIAAALLSRNARRAGLRPPAWVKTSLAPGSPAAARYLQRAGLAEELAAIGFDIVGFGCTTCIGNSGPLVREMSVAITEGTLAVAILSGNRNFPGRVHPELEASFLASPPLVVAYALAGDANRDIFADSISTGRDGAPVHLGDLWPTGAEIDAVLAASADPADASVAFAEASRSRAWEALEVPAGACFPWDPASTYVQPPPFAGDPPGTRLGQYSAHPLLVLGDDITTDHISPAGQIRPESGAGRHLIAMGAPAGDLNVYAARRGNWKVMLRGLFDNRSVRNLLDDRCSRGATVQVSSGEILPLHVAARSYANAGEPVVIVAGERFGMGSSRDWAAKGQALLGVRAVLAVGFERIHRSNLIGMGILPLRLPATARPAALGIRPGDRIELDVLPDGLAPRIDVTVLLAHADGRRIELACRAEVETELEVDQLRAGGVIPLILRKFMN